MAPPVGPRLNGTGHCGDGVPGAVVGQVEGGGEHVVHGRVGRHGRRDRSGEDRRRLPSVARLVCPGQVGRLGVRARRVAGVDDADRRHVHRGPAVDHVADPAFAGINVAVVQPGDQPLLSQEHPQQRHGLPLKLGDPGQVVHHLRHQVLGHVVRGQVPPLLGVAPDAESRRPCSSRR